MAAKRMLTAAAFIGVAVFLSVSFVTYDGVSDPHEMGSWSNLCGQAGRSIADALLSTFGAGAFVLAFFALFVGHSLMTSRPFASPFIKCIGALLATATLATIIQSLDPTAGYARSPYLLGGVVGDTAAATMTEYFGGVGSALLLALLLVASALLATDTFFMEAAAGIPELGEIVLRWLRRPAVALAAVIGQARGGTSSARSTSTKPKPERSRRKAKLELPPPLEPLDEVLDDDVRLLDGPLAEDVDVDDDEAELESLLEEVEVEDDGDEIEFEDGDEDEEEEDETLLEEDEEVLDDAEGDEEVEEEAEDIAPPRSEPVIKRGQVRMTSDTVEILELSREKHVEGKETYPLPPLNLLDEPGRQRRRRARLGDPPQGAQARGDARDLRHRRPRRRDLPRPDHHGLRDRAGRRHQGQAHHRAARRHLHGAQGGARSASSRRSRASRRSASRCRTTTASRCVLKELALSDELQRSKINIPLFLGKDAAGEPGHRGPDADAPPAHRRPDRLGQVGVHQQRHPQPAADKVPRGGQADPHRPEDGRAAGLPQRARTC